MTFRRTVRASASRRTTVDDADPQVPAYAHAHPKRRKKVAIVGGSPSRRRAPFKNRSWDIWAFSSRRAKYPRISCWFEIHALPDLQQQLATKKRGRRSYGNYMRHMRRMKCPVYMQSVHRRIPASYVFPKKRLVKEYGRIFTSTASFLVALAISEGYETIGLWGIDARGMEYKRQRAAIRYLLYLARRKGIRVIVSRTSAIRVPRRRPRYVRTKVLYAYDWHARGAWWRRRVRVRKRRRRLRLTLRLRRRRITFRGRYKPRTRLRRRREQRGRLRCRLRR